MEEMKGRRKVLEPKTLLGTVALSTVVYVLWQPAVQLLLHATSGDPLPFSTRAEWGRFIGVCAAVGVVAGLAWWYAARLPRRSLLHAWVRSSVTMLAVGVIISADEFARDDLFGWLLTLVVVALTTGALFSPLYRGSEGDDTTSPRRRSGTS